MNMVPHIRRTRNHGVNLSYTVVFGFTHPDTGERVNPGDSVELNDADAKRLTRDNCVTRDDDARDAKRENADARDDASVNASRRKRQKSVVADVSDADAHTDADVVTREA